MGTIKRPTVKETLAHRFATDTAIAWRTKFPTRDAPPNNVPQFSGQLVAVMSAPGKCKLFVGSQDQTSWIEVG